MRVQTAKGRGVSQLNTSESLRSSDFYSFVRLHFISLVNLNLTYKRRRDWCPSKFFCAWGPRLVCWEGSSRRSAGQPASFNGSLDGHGVYVFLGFAGRLFKANTKTTLDCKQSRASSKHQLENNDKQAFFGKSISPNHLEALSSVRACKGESQCACLIRRSIVVQGWRCG